jgi:alcohol dehydrogenase (cytochrome c)
MSTILRSALLFSSLAVPGSCAFAFTAEQAAAGRAAFEQTCAMCHGQNLRQLPNALLAGPEFVGRWGNRATGDLVTQARSTMPPDNPGGLPADTYTNIVAYLLQVNGGTASENEIDASTTARIGQGLTGQAVAVAAVAAPSAPPAPTGVIVAGNVERFTPVTDAMLRNPSSDDWLMLRHDYSATSYSPLAQITPANAHQLRLAWIWPMRDGGTNQPAPVVHDGTLYLANTGGILQALDAKTGDLIWEHHVGADISPRGIALYQNLVIFESAGEWAVRPQAARLIALDARTGQTVWNVELPGVYATNSGPIVANGLLIQGGGTCTVYEETKCSISAYDAATGEQRWLFHTVAIDGEPGGDSWGGLPNLYRAGGEAWITGSYDPDLNLTYWGTDRRAAPTARARTPGRRSSPR